MRAQTLEHGFTLPLLSERAAPPRWLKPDVNEDREAHQQDERGDEIEARLGHHATPHFVVLSSGGAVNARARRTS